MLIYDKIIAIDVLDTFYANRYRIQPMPDRPKAFVGGTWQSFLVSSILSQPEFHFPSLSTFEHSPSLRSGGPRMTRALSLP